VRHRTLTLRALALLGAGSAVIHELRYMIGYGPSAAHALAAHPHGYLSVLLPGVITATLIALASVLLRAAGARRSGLNEPAAAFQPSLPVLWLACALALAVIYGTQETVEGAGAVLGGGWIGLALALPVGLLVALALRGADAAESLTRRAPSLRVFVIAAAPVGLRALLPPSRRVLTPLGARAPPAAPVI
jgi:hypothetical protein